MILAYLCFRNCRMLRDRLLCRDLWPGWCVWNFTLEISNCVLASHVMHVSGVCRSQGSIRNELLIVCSRNVLDCRQADLRGLRKHTILRVQTHSAKVIPHPQTTSLRMNRLQTLLCHRSQATCSSIDHKGGNYMPSLDLPKK
jgi:hypothetical protein